MPEPDDSSGPLDTVDTVVVGAGVVGLAVGRAMALAGHEVMIVDAADAIGTQTSSRNSEVIHAGIYYPEGSRKAVACVRGRELLYRYCAERGIPHRRIGKLIVATTVDQLGDLARIRAHAEANGVDDLQELDAGRLHELEPELDAVGALLSPSTGIVDSHALMRSFRRDLERSGGDVVLRTTVTGGRVDGRESVVEFGDGGAVRCRYLVNCAGLSAWQVAAAVDGYPPELLPPRHLAQGNYFTLAHGSAPFDHLIYPVPVDGGLGVHLTLDLAGAARFGPDVQWLPGDTPVQQLDYHVEAQRAQSFSEEIRRYWPGLPDDALAPAYAGVRPKLSGPGQPGADFAVIGPERHGIPGVVHLFGIESPGLTSCLALADMVVELLR